MTTCCTCKSLSLTCKKKVLRLFLQKSRSKHSAWGPGVRILKLSSSSIWLLEQVNIFYKSQNIFVPLTGLQVLINNNRCFLKLILRFSAVMRHHTCKSLSQDTQQTIKQQIICYLTFVSSSCEAIPS